MEDAFTRMIEVGWARPAGRFRRVFTDMLMPGPLGADDLGGRPDAHVHVHGQRGCLPAAAAGCRRRRVASAGRSAHPGAARQGRSVQRFFRRQETGRGIPGARLVTLESDNHVLLADEPAWPVFLAEIDAFLEPDRQFDRQFDRRGPSRSGGGRVGSPALDALTARERDVLRLVAAGQDNREIAATLTLSVRTVERHLQNHLPQAGSRRIGAADRRRGVAREQRRPVGAHEREAERRSTGCREGAHADRGERTRLNTAARKHCCAKHCCAKHGCRGCALVQGVPGVGAVVSAP